MKKITLLLTFLVAFGYSTYAQVSSYTFTQNSGTYTENSAGATAVAGALADSYMSDALPIGFTFNYDGNAYTQFKMSSNGVISFNMTGTLNLTTNDLSSANATSRPIIAPLWDDLDGRATGGSFANYEVTGIVGNRVLTVEWRNWEWNYNSSTAAISFQVKLYETTNVIEFVYRQEAGAVTSGTATIGIGSAMGSGAGSYLNVTNVATPAVSSSTSTTNINTKPATGQIYRFAPPSCVAPGGFAASAITTSSATISWSSSTPAPSNGYQYFYSDVNTAPTTPSASIAGLTDNLATLNSATTYYVWLRSDCGGTFSAWNGPFTFVTNCVSVTDFTQNFDGVTAPAMPVCFTRVGTTGTVNTQTATPASGVNTMYIYGTSAVNQAVVKLQPVSNLGAGTHRLKFKMRSNFTNGGIIEVGYLTNSSDANSFVVLGTTTASSTTYADYSVTPAAGVYTDDIAIRHTGVPANSILIDDIAWEPIPNVVPTCSTITAPVDAALNVTNSRVTWTASLDATSYKIFAGTAPGATDVLNGVNTLGLTTYVVPTDPGSTYFVKIVPFNATGDAVGCTEISFTTCDALVPEFIETFSTFLPSCWQSADNGNLTTGPATFGASGWVAEGFANAGTTGAIRYELWLATANDWIISPIVSIPLTGYELKFDAAATQRASSNAPTTAWEADDFVEVLVSTTGFDNWTVLYTYNSTNVPAPAGTANVIDLDAYAGQDVRFAFRAVEGATNGSADIDFFIDNFEVRLTPSSVPVCATNIVATPNATCGNFASTITWNAVAGADGYRITVGATSGGTTIANNVNIGNTTTYSFVGNVGTTYYYTIVPFNAAGSAVGCTENSFATVATSCYCPSTPTSVDGLGITGVQIGSTTVTNTVSSSPVYSNNTTPIDMFQGISNNVQVSFDTDYGYSYHVVIWVDANDNYTFEPSEIVYTGVSLDDPTTTLNASFVMPSATPLGNHRMRIVATYDQQIPSNPCYGASYGETVDFIVNVVATASSNSFDNANFVAYPNPVKDVLNLSYTSEISTVRVLNLLGQEVVSKAVNGTSTQVDMSQLNAGTYIVNVTVGDAVKSIKVIKQ